MNPEDSTLDARGGLEILSVRFPKGLWWAKIPSLHTTSSVMSLNSVTSSEALETVTNPWGASHLSTISEGPKEARP